jgi:hypothetical protein
VTDRGFVARIMVLTEDHYPEPHRALVRAMLRLVKPNHNAAKIDVQGDDSRAQEAAQGNRGKNRKGPGHQQRVALARAIATEIFTPSNFVFYHVDADRCFSAPKVPKPENEVFFESVLLAVRQLLEALKEQHQDSRTTDEMIARVMLLLPYYSIEAWLFQNTRVGRELCAKHHRAQHVEKFDHWEQNRHELDECEKPKDACCLNTSHYRDLAMREYPARAVYAIGKSFAETVDRLSNCASLRAALDLAAY